MRWIIGAAIALGLIIGLTQVIIPNKVEGDVKDRLTKNGGRADVAITVFPALRLLFGDGDELKIRARRLDIPVRSLAGGSFKDMDGFDEVDVRMADTRVGPFDARQIVLARAEGKDFYNFVFLGSTTAGRLADFALGSLPPVFRSLIESIGGRPASQEIPIRLNADLVSEDGTARVARGSGTVAGIPLGGISLSIAGAIINRITG